MFQFFWTRTASVWVAALYILMGVLLFVFPAASSTLFIWALAAGAGAYGLIHLIRYLQARKMGCGNPGDVFLTVLPAAFAVFSLIWPQAVLSVLPLVLGSLLLVDGVGKLPLAYMGVREQHPGMVPMLLSSIVPILTMQLVVMVFGAALAADGISDLVTVILEKRSAQTVQHHSSI